MFLKECSGLERSQLMIVLGRANGLGRSKLINGLETTLLINYFFKTISFFPRPFINSLLSRSFHSFNTIYHMNSFKTIWFLLRPFINRVVSRPVVNLLPSRSLALSRPFINWLLGFHPFTNDFSVLKLAVLVLYKCKVRFTSVKCGLKV